MTDLSFQNLFFGNFGESELADGALSKNLAVLEYLVERLNLVVSDGQMELVESPHQ